MKNLNRDFLEFQAQTSPSLMMGLDVDRARGSYIFGRNGKKYLDFVAGVSVNTLGHSHPVVNQAIKDQLDKHSHVMVYGEFIYESSVKVCELLASKLPKNLSNTYLVNSGTEAIEGALKLAKRYTSREKIIAFKNSYHGNTHGSLSVSGREIQKRAFRPLLPEIEFISFNEINDLDKITSDVAGVIIEPIQGAAGFVLPEEGFLKKLRKKCDEAGSLLIYDEIQPGFGRTAKLFAFEWYDAVPDILVVGKGMANGLPIGAFVSSSRIMNSLSFEPILGHITTFGGNPVIAAAAKATIEVLYKEKLMDQIQIKEIVFREWLSHPAIKIHGRGLMLALEMDTTKLADELLQKCFRDGLVLFKLLYRPNFLRITPPLTITHKEIEKGCGILIKNLNQLLRKTKN